MPLQRKLSHCGQWAFLSLMLILSGNSQLSTAAAAPTDGELSADQRALLDAAEAGDIATVAQLLGRPDVDVNIANDEGDTALILAAVAGHPDVVRRLLAVPTIDINHANSSGDTALIMAALYCHTAVVSQLLAKPDIDINLANLGGCTALFCNYHEGSCPAAISQLLAMPHIEINHADGIGNTPLIWAARCGYPEVVAQLLAMPGIEIDHANESGNTALIMAACGGHDTIITQLLAMTAGINIDHAARDGTTALSCAIEGAKRAAREADFADSGIRYTGIILQLILAGAVVPADLVDSPIIQATQKRLLDFIAAASSGELATMQRLVAEGLPPKPLLLNQALAAVIQAELADDDWLAVLQLLKAYGADLNVAAPSAGVRESKADDPATDTSLIVPKTVLEAAILRNNPELVQTVLNWGAEPTLAPAVLDYLAQFTPRSDKPATAQAEIMIAATKAGWDATAAAQAIEIANMMREAQVLRGDPSSLLKLKTMTPKF